MELQNKTDWAIVERLETHEVNNQDCTSYQTIPVMAAAEYVAQELSYPDTSDPIDVRSLESITLDLSNVNDD